jgi:capsular polysaccharide export protein
MNEQMQRVAILSAGVWQLRDAIHEITGFEPVRWLPPFQRPAFGCVVGWGLKPTSTRARELSIKTDASYIALEDGFIRSVEPGPDEPPLSLVVDRLGVHYDASAVSELEVLITRSAYNQDKARLIRAADGIARLRAQMISKYNHAPCRSETALRLDPSRRHGRVLVIDQTRGDSSIAYGKATAAVFERMLAAARAENPGAEIVVKLHPEVVSGRKKGHLGHVADDADTRVMRDNVNPWVLIEGVDRIYVVTSQMGLEGVMAGREVVCFGAPFYAGWGLTDDRVAIPRRTARPTVEQLFAAIYFDYSRYISPETCREISFEEAVAWLIGRKAATVRPGRTSWFRRAAGSNVLRPVRSRQRAANA